MKLNGSGTLALALAMGMGGAGVVLDAQPAEAASLTWTLIGVSFTDGTTAVGSFDYDADTFVYSNLSITLDNPIPGNGVPGFTLPRTFITSGIDVAGSQTLSSIESPDFFSLVYSNPLTNAGGTIPLVAAYGRGGSGSAFGSGTLSAPSGVPVPAPPGVLGLLLSGALAARQRLKCPSVAKVKASSTT